jgi:hypothetical protein
MKRTYTCPHCGGRLKPNLKIILRAKLHGRRGLLLFSPQPGNYDVIAPEVFNLRKKDVVEFSCPICGEDLTSPRRKAHAEICFEYSTGTSGTVVFSKVFGHHETYFVTSEEVRSYGEHASSEGLNYWGVGPDR